MEPIRALQPPAPEPTPPEAEGDVSASEPGTLPPGMRKKRKVRTRPGGNARSVETVFRTAYRELLDQTRIADNKAGIMTSINGVVLSVIMAFGSSIVRSGWTLILPCALLLVTAVASAVFSVLAARPQIQKEAATLEDMRNDTANPLYFGTMAQLDRDDFAEALVDMLDDSKRSYLNMARNLHGIGAVLPRKFGLLWYAYTTFIVGLCSAVALYGLLIAAQIWTET